MKEELTKRKFNIDIEAVKELVDLVKVSKIGRIKVSVDDVEIEVESQQFKVAATVPTSTLIEKSGSGESKEALDSNVLKNELEASGHLENCPIVGTFYASPSPGKPAFVEVGSSVKKGDVLYIVESMKLMNEVKSEVDGIVKKIFVKSGDPVEYGQPIMLID